MGKQVITLDFGLYRDVYTINVVSAEVPVISGVINGKTYCGAQEVTVTDAKVIRVHEGVADILDAAFDAKTGKLSFETDKFSTYTLVYSDAPSSDNSPTGDSAMIVLFGGLLALSALAAAVILVPDFRKKLMGN